MNFPAIPNNILGVARLGLQILGRLELAKDQKPGPQDGLRPYNS